MKERNQMISSFFYYVLYSSAILVYGIGINKANMLTETTSTVLIEGLKMILSVVGTATLTYLISYSLLLPVNLMELYPFVAVLIFAFISIIIESFVRITAKKNTAGYGVSVLCVLLAVSESTSLSECVLISCFCVFSFYLLVPFLYAIRKRIEVSRPMEEFENSSLIYISIAIIMIILLAWNVSWLNPGVFNW